MKHHADAGSRRRSLGLILALVVNLTLWSLAGIALASRAHQSGGAGLDGFGLLQWKAS